MKFDKIAERVCSSTGQTPWSLFTNEDKAAMLSLPMNRYERPSWHILKVHRDHHIVLGGSFYSVPYSYIGSEVVARCGNRLVQIFSRERLVKTHIRARSKGCWVTDQRDYPEEVRIYLEEDKDAYLSKAASVGKSTYKFCYQVLKQQTFTNKRKVLAVLRLAKKHGKHNLEMACEQGLRCENFTYVNLQKLLLEDKKATKEGKGALPGAYLRDPKEFLHTNIKEVKDGSACIN
jgi:hypothetical protein